MMNRRFTNPALVVLLGLIVTMETFATAVVEHDARRSQTERQN